MFVRGPKNIYDTNYKHDNGVNNISEWNLLHDTLNNGINNISEWNLLHDILDTSKLVKITDYHYYPILHGLINNYQIVLFNLAFRSRLPFKSSAGLIKKSPVLKTNFIF